MEMGFTCPKTKKFFTSGEWRPIGHIKIVEFPDRSKTLDGEVEVKCPICSEVHSVSPMDILCTVNSCSGSIKKGKEE